MKNVICIECGWKFEEEEALTYTCPNCGTTLEELDEDILTKIRTSGGSVGKPPHGK